MAVLFNLVQVVEDQTRIGVISFSTMVRSDILLGQYLTPTPDMLPAIWEIPYMAGVTNTADGILRMHEMFTDRRRPYVQQICILVTDGLSNVNHNDTIGNAEAAKADDIEIFAIGESILAVSIHCNKGS